VAVPERAGELVLEVYNVLGQRVRTLHRGVLPAGRHRFVWDGRDEKGRAAASGVYLYRLRAGDFRAVRAAVLLR
jgi:flagellar hook assembly protein FlgD